MAEMLQYKCPNCGGKIEFDSATQKMICPYCDTEFDVDTLKNYDEALNNQQSDKMDWDTNAGGDWENGETDNMMVYTCNSCGGELITDENTAATSCPYCGNPVILTGRLSGVLKPDYVIPFKLDKKAAIAALSDHLSNKKLLPKVFKDQNHLDEIKGVYVPFWLFDCDSHANVNYRCTRIRTWSDRNYRYTETSHFLATRVGDISFDHVPVDGSTAMPDDLMESIEPFDFSQAVDFQTAFLSGYLADKYDVDAAQSITRANERVKNSTEEAFKSTVVGYNTVIPENSSVQIANGNAKYALYPVWLLNTTWNGEKYLFAMNGQTGKFVGNLPCDKSAYWRWLLSLTGIFAVVFAIIVYFLFFN